MANPYLLGCFVGGPEYGPGELTNFTTLVGTAPTVLNVYMDGTQASLPNTGSASYGAGNFAGNAPWNDEVNGKRINIPLIGSPMGSSGVSDAQNLAYLQGVAAGEYDAQIKQFVLNYSNNGFMTQYWRPGVEMNLSSTPGYNSYLSNPAVWIAAFQRYYTVLHEQGATSGVTIKVIWNPGCCSDTSIGNATKTLYPGADFCDFIGGDFYDDLYPFAPLTDAEVLASPAAQEAYYTNTAMNGTVLDATNGIALPVPSLAAFARAQGKPFCLPECGAGKGPADNPTFWIWLRATLDAHVKAGGEVAFVSMWDSNGGGQYQFTGGQQPNACTAIAANFGVNAPAIAGSTNSGSGHAPSPADTTVNGTTGTIYDTSGNAWTITAAQTIAMNGTPVPVSADVVTLFWNGKALSQLNSSGAWWTQPLDGSEGTELTAAPAGYKAPVTPPASISTTALPQSEFTVYLAADVYEGSAEAEIQVDGVIVATKLAVTASRGANQEQAFTWTGSYGAGTHAVKVTFLNDAHGASKAEDRNLYFNSVLADGKSYTPSRVGLTSTGSNGSATVTTSH